MHPSEFRDRLTLYCYHGNQDKDASAILDSALLAMCHAEPLLNKMEAAQKAGLLSKDLSFEVTVQGALRQAILNETEAASLLEFEKLRKKVIAVDEFESMN